MKLKIEKALTDGLAKGYALAEPTPVTREKFRGLSTDVQFPKGSYHDEWFGRESGGGQELVQVEGHQYTRLYAGGTVSQEKLAQLGITSEDVIGYLMQKIQELGPRTRLHRNCIPRSDKKWQYLYEIMRQNRALEITNARERILFKGTLVHEHSFMLCPIR